MTAKSSSGHIQDAVLGLLTSAVGAVAVILSTGYRGASGAYPGALGGFLVLMGIFLVVRAAIRSGKIEAVRPLATSPSHLFAALIGGAVYLFLVPIIGFYTSSAMVVLLLPVVLGIRRPVLLIVSTAIFMIVVYATFSILLQKPLPPELWQF